jgi:hypothetical protein
MAMNGPLAAAIVTFACLLAACGGAARLPTVTPDVCAGKGTLPVPPFFFLDYPANGSTDIPTNAGVLIEIGADNGTYPNATLSVSSASAIVPLGAPTSLPSPLPTPFATPSPSSAQPYTAIQLPKLAPSTNYTVFATYLWYADNPPSCTAPVTQPLGGFTTQ